jgi:hypothetical protein
METPWKTAADICPFASMVRLSPCASILHRRLASNDTRLQLISLIYRGNFKISRPNTSLYSDEGNAIDIAKHQFHYIGLFPSATPEIVSD